MREDVTVQTTRVLVSFYTWLVSKRGRPNATETFVSFVVIAYNEAANIARALGAIAELDDLGDHEIIVVDDGSSDGTAQVVADIAARDPWVRLIELPENRGRGYARCTGVAAACGGLIAMVDADITLPADWLARARAALADHDAVGGIAVPDGDVAYIHRRFRLEPRVVRGSTSVTGNNGLYRRAVFEEVGFDPALREGEDVALNHAMRRRGLSSATVPGLLVRHKESKTLATSLRWLFDSGRGATRQLLTYRQVRQPDLVAGAFVGAAALGMSLTARRHRLAGSAIPVSFVLAASVQHVRSRFETPVGRWTRVAPAVAVDAAMLTAYFAGRLAGLATPTSWPARCSQHSDEGGGDRLERPA
jgi:GT2 family glycosyltransferase